MTFSVHEPQICDSEEKLDNAQLMMGVTTVSTGNLPFGAHTVKIGLTREMPLDFAGISSSHVSWVFSCSMET